MKLENRQQNLAFGAVFVPGKSNSQIRKQLHFVLKQNGVNNQFHETLCSIVGDKFAQTINSKEFPDVQKLLRVKRLSLIGDIILSKAVSDIEMIAMLAEAGFKKLSIIPDNKLKIQKH